jgi:hypothetical protein
MARRYTGFPVEVLEVVEVRSHGACEVMLPGCTLRWEDTQHRRARGAGGTRRVSTNQASNALACCRACHRSIEGAPVRSARKGWRVAQHEDPLLVPVLWRGRDLVFLDDLGGMHSQPPTTIEEASW